MLNTFIHALYIIFTLMLYASFCYLNRIQFGRFNRQNTAIVLSPMRVKRAHSLVPPQVLTPDSMRAVELPLVRSSAKEIGLVQT